MSTALNIPELLSSGESETVEFKTSFGREAVETIVAFANTRGGTLLAGVKDDGRVCGITTGKETLNQWLEQIKSKTSPTIIPDITAHDISDRTVVAVQIAEYPVKPVNTRGRYFKRVSSSNQQLTLAEINEFYMKSLQVSWDAHVAENTSLDDLDLSK